MNLSAEALKQIPSFVVVNGDKITVSGSRRDIHAWMQADMIRRANAFVIHDNCGCLLKRYKGVLQRNGYEVNVFDTACGAKKARYNPFSYIRDGKGITELADAVMRGTKSGNGEDYGFILTEWVLLRTIFGYIHENAADYEMNFKTAIEMLKGMETYDGDDEYKTAVDLIFEGLEQHDPDNQSLQRYKYFKTTPYARDNRIWESCAERLTPLATELNWDYFMDDELGFSKLFYLKIALFVRTDKNCAVSNILAPLMYSQFFKEAYKHAIE